MKCLLTGLVSLLLLASPILALGLPTLVLLKEAPIRGRQLVLQGAELNVPEHSGASFRRPEGELRHQLLPSRRRLW